MAAKSLPGHPEAERLAHLRAYLLAWLRDHVHRTADLLDPLVMSTLKQGLWTDLTQVFGGLGLSTEGMVDMLTDAAGAKLARLAREHGGKLLERLFTPEKRG